MLFLTFLINLENFIESNSTKSYIFYFGIKIYNGKTKCEIDGMNLKPKQQ